MMQAEQRAMISVKQKVDGTYSSGACMAVLVPDRSRR